MEVELREPYMLSMHSVPSYMPPSPTVLLFLPLVLVNVGSPGIIVELF